jgi:hypothetical protein
VPAVPRPRQVARQRPRLATRATTSRENQRPEAPIAPPTRASLPRFVFISLPTLRSTCPNGVGGQFALLPMAISARLILARVVPHAQRASCSIADLKPTSDEERTVLLNIARRCKPIDQCLLECIRSGCAGGIGGGCFHACGIRGVPPDERDAVLLREAAAYRARTHYFCRSREHESR